jgi:hypothetical protein
MFLDFFPKLQCQRKPDSRRYLGLLEKYHRPNHFSVSIAEDFDVFKIIENTAVILITGEKKGN